MKRRSWLRSKTPLKPGKPPKRRTSLREVSLKRAATLPANRRPKDTGPDRTTRELVLERDNWSCCRCGTPIIDQPYSLQHRVARGMGGTSDRAANRPSNLIVLCGTATTPDGCHLRAERRLAEDHDAGFWLNSWEHPTQVWVHHAQYGIVRLLDDGGVVLAPYVNGDPS